jgi:hypothetical protein
MATMANGCPVASLRSHRLHAVLVRRALADLLRGARGTTDWLGLGMRRGLECDH